MEGTKQRQLRSKTCPICQQTFTRHQALKDHISAHRGEKRYKCSSCHAPFARQNDRRVHEREQHGDCPMFACRITTPTGDVMGCHRAFRRKSHLARHLRSATGESCRALCRAAALSAGEVPDIVEGNDFFVEHNEAPHAEMLGLRSPTHITSSSIQSWNSSPPALYHIIDASSFTDHFWAVHQAVEHGQSMLTTFIQHKRGQVFGSLSKSTPGLALLELHVALSAQLRRLLSYRELIPARMCVNALFTIDAALENFSALQQHAGLVNFLWNHFKTHGNQQDKRSGVRTVSQGMWTSTGRHYLPVDYVKWLRERPDLYESGTLALRAVETLKVDNSAFVCEFW